LGSDFLASTFVEKHVQTRPRTDTHVVLTLRADIQGFLQLRLVQHGITGGTLVPEAFRDRAFLYLRTHDRRDQLVYQPVAHACSTPSEAKFLSGRQGRRQSRTMQCHVRLWTVAWYASSHLAGQSGT